MGGVYIIIGDQTLPKGGVSPRKVPHPPPPPPHPTHHTGSAVLDSAVTAFRAVTLGAAWDVGMACNILSCFGHTHRMCRPVPVCTL